MTRSAFFKLEGAALDAFGSGVATAGNFDGGASGISEFVLGAAGDGTTGATIYSGVDSAVGDGVLADGSSFAALSFVTGEAGDGAGATVLGGFDFNGDGITDVAVAAPESTGGSGKVYVIYGSSAPLTGTVTLSDLGSRVTEISFADVSGLGAALAAGDVNNDGIDDLFIGAPAYGAGSDAGQGAVYVVAGASAHGTTAAITAQTALITGTAGGDALGSALSSGDVNGDGIDDLAIGAPGVDGADFDRGAAYILFGVNGGTLFDGLDVGALTGADGFAVTGVGAGDGLGSSVAISGDTFPTLDGIGDLHVAIPGEDDGGQNGGVVLGFKGSSVNSATVPAALGSSGTAASEVIGDASGQLHGPVVALGDVTGDGVDDIAYVTSVVSERTFGTATLAAGTKSILIEAGNDQGLYMIGNLDPGLTPGDISVAGLGDVNNDGIGDIGIGLPGTNGTGQVLGLLGGSANLDALDASDGTSDDIIDASRLLATTPASVTFAQTDTSIALGGVITGAIDLRQSQSTADGTLSITDANDAGASFDTLADTTAEGSGTFGDVTVRTDSGEQRWRYELNTGAVAALAYLGAGETVVDTVLLTASQGSQQQVSVEITGVDDPTVVTVSGGGSTIVLSEDLVLVEGTISVSDPDQNDTPDISGLSQTGTFGTLQINGDGTGFTYAILDSALAGLQALGSGQQSTETFTLDANGIDVVIDVQINGEDETTGGAPKTVDAADGPQSFGPGAENVTLTGTAGATVDTGAGDDQVTDSAGGDVITDPFGDDTVSTSGGNDHVRVLSGDNTITETGTDATESNWLRGGIGSDEIIGGAGKDIIDGDSVSPFMGGSDTLDGNGGDDVLRGGVGADTFVFRPNGASDTVAEFSSVVGDAASGFQAAGFSRDYTPGFDQLDLSAMTTVNSAADAFAAINDNASGWAEFNAEGTRFVLFGVTEAELSDSDFIF